MISVNNGRAEIEDRLTPTLRKRVLAGLPKLYERARRNAVLALGDRGEPTPAAALSLECPYRLDDVLNVEWLPEPLRGAPQPTVT